MARLQKERNRKRSTDRLVDLQKTRTMLWLSGVVLLGIGVASCLDHPDGGGPSHQSPDLGQDSQLDGADDQVCWECGDADLDDAEIAADQGPDTEVTEDPSDQETLDGGGGDGWLEEIPPTPLVGGFVSYLDRPYDQDGFLPDTVQNGAPLVKIELVRVRDHHLIASTESDEFGGFTLELSIRTEEPVRVEVVSEVVSDRYSISVIDRRGFDQYRFQGEPFLLPEGEEPPIWLDIAIQEEELAPAFNILDVTRQGLQWVLETHPDPEIDLSALTVIWQAGKASPCGTCYFAGFIDLQGSEEDPDGYDDDIILHEVGHFVQQNLSVDDSPGGSHDGSPTDPNLAYSEGVAAFFSCWVRQTATYQDYLATGWKFREHEMLREEYEGTSDGELDGLVSEILVTAVMWDLFDDSPEELHDLLSGNEVLAGALFDTLPARGRENLGARGVDLADFIEAARCHLTDQGPLQDIVDQVEYPFDFSTPARCP